MENKYSLMCKALGDPNRLKIFIMLKKGKLCACKILEEFHITQPTLSYHMKLLVESRLVDIERRGSWNHYSINTKMLDDLVKFLIEK